MSKLTKKQDTIVKHILQLEKEKKCTIYFKYDNFTKKIHPIKINSLDKKEMNIERFPAICSHNVAINMENKGILITEKIGDQLSLCKLNHQYIN